MAILRRWTPSQDRPRSTPRTPTTSPPASPSASAPASGSTRLVAGRPYRTLSALEHAATEAAADLSDDGLREALAAHPRIGERPTGASVEAEHSRREQAGVLADDTTATRLHAANVAYEERFGHVFLVRAAGRTAEEVLRAAQDRLGNDPATEGLVVRQQLGEIAVLRLQDLLADLVAARTDGAAQA